MLEMRDLIESHIARTPSRVTGNEMSREMCSWLGQLLPEERDALVATLRDYLSFRRLPSERSFDDARPEARVWLALNLATELRLTELMIDVAGLLDHVERGRTLLPIYARGIARHLTELRKASSAVAQKVEPGTV